MWLVVVVGDEDEEMNTNLDALHQQLADIDLLYVRGPATVMTYIDLMNLQDELEALLDRRVDLVPKAGLHRLIRDQVLADARVLYAMSSSISTSPSTGNTVRDTAQVAVPALASQVLAHLRATNADLLKNLGCPE